jgi:hypothetical protein
MCSFSYENSGSQYQLVAVELSSPKNQLESSHRYGEEYLSNKAVGKGINKAFY